MKNNHAIGWLVTLVITFLILLIPINQTFNYNIKTFFAITICIILIIAFELLPRIVSSLLLPIMYCSFALVDFETAFSSWLTPTIGIIFGGLLLCSILKECGIFKRISYKIILLFGGTYKGAVFGCFFIGIVLNIITFCNAWLIAGGLVYSICQSMELKPSKESAILCFSGILGASGPTVFLYYPGYYLILESCVRYFIPDYNISMFVSFIYNGFGLILFYLLILFILKFSKIDYSKIKDGKELFEAKYKSLGKFSYEEKIALAAVVTLIIYLFIATLNSWPVLYGFLTIPLITLVLINKQSAKILKSVDYSIIVFISSCLGIGIVGKAIGFDTFLLEVTQPMLNDIGPFTLLLILLICGILANFFMTPYAMLGGLSIPFVEIGLKLGINPICVLMTLLWSCEILIFPYESAGYFIMYGYDMISLKRFIKFNLIKSLLMILSFIFVLYPLWDSLNLIFLK